MPNISKFDNSTRLALIEHYAMGLTYEQIASRLGITRMTLNRWIKKYGLSDIMKAARHEFMSAKAENALWKLADGAEAVETIKIYDAEGNLKSITEKIRKDIPDIRAAQVLARRYNAEFSDITRNTDNTKNISMHINMHDMTSREVRELNMHSNPLGDIELHNDAYSIHTDNTESIPVHTDAYEDAELYNDAQNGPPSRDSSED